MMAPAPKRICRTCAVTKRDGEFRRSRSQCRDCERAAVRIYGQTNRPKRNERLRRWRKANPEAARALDRRKKLKRKYDLTPEQVEQMREVQGGRCALCGKDRELVIDHCHASNRVRALLCTPCNNGLGWIESNPGLLSRLGAYLDRPSRG